MSVDIRSSERRKYMNEIQQAREKEIAAGLVKVSSPSSPKGVQENDKRIRREIANSNERRRMQCINAGFSALKALIPQLEGEKLSKAAILQHTIEYINTLKNEKSHLQLQVERANRLLSELGQDRMVSSTPPPPKRKKRDTESSDEGVGSLSDASDEGGSELRQENEALRSELRALEERSRLLENQLMHMLHVPAPSSNLRDLNPTDMQTSHPEPVYKGGFVEVIASRDYSPPPTSTVMMPIRPLSPTPDRGMLVEMSAVPVTANNAITTRIIEPVAQASTIVKMEAKDSVSPSLVASSTLSVPPSSSPSIITASSACTTSSSSLSREQPTPRSSSPHLHTYSHRDHPRRRHHQAQLERQRIEEEELRQKQEQERQQQQLQLSSSRPHYGSQNLDSLVKAICHVEGSKSLCDERKFYDEDHKMYDRRQLFLTSEESERDNSSISDQEEMKSEISGRESPLHSSHLHPYHHLHHHHHQKQQQQIITSHCLPRPASIPGSSSSYTEKYPIAHNLLLCTPSICRPGVIVQKQS